MSPGLRQVVEPLKRRILRNSFDENYDHEVLRPQVQRAPRPWALHFLDPPPRPSKLTVIDH